MANKTANKKKQGLHKKLLKNQKFKSIVGNKNIQAASTLFYIALAIIAIWFAVSLLLG